MALHVYLVLVFILLTTHGEQTQTGICKDVLQGYLTGKLSYQVEALKQEFKSFKDVINVIEESMKKFKDAVNASIQEGGIANRDIIYTRWGKKKCPSNAKLVYSGFVGGSHAGHKGAAVEPLCLPRDPEWGLYKDGFEGAKAYIFGGEYEANTFTGHFTSLHDHNVPCAVCLVQKRSVVKMFPARKTCFKGWKLEYQGYLMAGHHNQQAGSTYTCVDKNPETLRGGHADENGYLFYFVEAHCGSLKCPPYFQGREIVCAVCSKK
ncbi:uncharacterized protein LOC134234212 [Saccostrea cucullata]|uniref:uncharacterized protein LOC134234212 n=1 Tax=Saccostrea cuccullata TaxID=36930 RepID=UPI002ED215CF